MKELLQSAVVYCEQWSNAKLDSGIWTISLLVNTSLCLSSGGNAIRALFIGQLKDEELNLWARVVWIRIRLLASLQHSLPTIKANKATLTWVHFMVLHLPTAVKMVQWIMVARKGGMQGRQKKSIKPAWRASILWEFSDWLTTSVEIIFHDILVDELKSLAKLSVTSFTNNSQDAIPAFT